MDLDRRAAAAVLLAFAAPSRVLGQATAKVARWAGVLENEPASKGLEAFRQGLRERGFVEGQNVAFEYRWTQGVVAEIPKLAAELSRLPLDVIFAPTTPAALAAKEADARPIPVVFAVAADPVGSKLVASLAKPGGNVTGLTTLDIRGGAEAAGDPRRAGGRQGSPQRALLFDPADASNQLLRKATEAPARRPRHDHPPIPGASPERI